MVFYKIDKKHRRYGVKFTKKKGMGLKSMGSKGFINYVDFTLQFLQHF